MSTKVKIDLGKLRERAKITLECLPEDVSVRGNAMASGDDDLDRKVEDEILEDLDRNEWAWCCVKVSASHGGVTESEYLGCCSYENEQRFREGGYFDDMVDSALSQLQERLTSIVGWAADVGIEGGGS